MKNFLALSAASAVALGISAWGVPAGAATVLKTSAALPTNHDYTDAFKEAFIKPLNAANGDVRMNYIGGPEVTPRQKQVPALKRGLIDVVKTPGSYYAGMVPSARLIGMQTKPIAELKKNGAWDILKAAHLKVANAKLIAWVHEEGHTFYMYTNFKPKLSKKTGVVLDKIKMRSTPLYNAFLKKMGATTVVMGAPDVYAALERGVVDGLCWPYGSAARLGWARFLKYRIKPNFFGGSVFVMINNDKFNSLSKAGKDLLLKYAAEYEKNAPKIILRKGAEDEKKLKAAGVQDIELTGAYRKAYIDTVYGAKWAQNDALDKAGKYNIDYKKLKSLMYDN